MKDLRSVIAKNIQELRTENKLTQLELAGILNYSDKAISKWERAEAIPDVTVLKRLADYFSVSVDYLLEEEHTTGLSEINLRKMQNRNRLIISLILVFGVFVPATLIFSLLILGRVSFAPWLVFLYAGAVSSIVALVLNCVWGRKKLNLLIISALIWITLTSVYLTLLVSVGLNWWAIFIVGIPAQGILLILSGMSSLKGRKELKQDDTPSDATPSAEKAD